MKEVVHDVEDQLARHPRILGVLTEFIANRPRVVIENPHHLACAREHLRRGSLVVYFAPHTTIWDPALVTQKVINPCLVPQSPEQFVWMTSAKFTGGIPTLPTMGIASVAAEEYARRMGFRMLPLVQQYLVKRANHDIIKQAREKNISSMDEAKRMLGNAGSIVAMSIEGTRGKTGGLLQAKEGTQKLLQVANTWALPITLIGAHRMQPTGLVGFDGLNPFVHVRIRIGEPVSYADAELLAEQHKWRDGGGLTVADALMLIIAQGGLDGRIPDVDPRGEYAWDRIMRLSQLE